MLEMDEMKNFVFEGAMVQIWLFKKHYDKGQLKITGRWVDADEKLDTAICVAIEEKITKITETTDYSLLASTNDGIALTLNVEETVADIIIDKISNPTPNLKVTSAKEIRNTDFYLIKVVSGEEHLYAVRKADTSWRSKKAVSILSAFYNDHQLSLNENPAFCISKYFDFLIFQNKIFVLNKSNFESILSYREEHAKNFKLLKEEDEFTSIFADITPIVEYVGSNALQLRRMSVIRQKGHYKDVNFMARLKEKYHEVNLILQFDDIGRIVPTKETCPDIIRVLLDHRLHSLFSQKNYDVQDAIGV